MENIENIKNNNIFKIPILYLKKCYKTEKNIINELELIKSLNYEEDKNNEETPIYYEIFQPNNIFSKIILEQIVSNYTNNINFLKESQYLLKEIDLNNIPNNNEFYENFKEKEKENENENIINLYNNIKNDTSFCEKFLFIDINYFKFLNNNSVFLKYLCYYNILSPLLSLLFPLLFLLIPFFVIILRGNNISFNNYLQLLKIILQNHIIGKILNEGLYNQPMLFIYLIIYIFSIYQNFLICYKFCKNTKTIIKSLNILKKYIDFSLKNMNYLINITKKYKTYKDFNKDLQNNINYLNSFNNKLNNILISYNNINQIQNVYTNINNIGLLMHNFYQLFNNKELENSLLYSFGFNGYLNNLINLKHQLNNNKINKATFYKKDKNNIKLNINKPKFISLYYPKFINSNILKIKKNKINLKKNVILTGPNASGKTTFIKSVLINLLLSQQIGFGCYKKLIFYPFSYFYCYVNIPDTLGRDSLFQAEARRCKNILDNVNKYNNETHFCIFDELFSGTNPEEAIISGYSFLKYINKKNNLCYLLTTHYYQLTNELSKDEKIQNYCMDTKILNNTIKFLYKIKVGINQIKGGLNVLKKFNYPKEMLCLKNL